MIIDIVKYVKGYAKVKVTGYSPERMLNLCSNKKIYLWGIKPIPNGFIFSVSYKALPMLDPILEKTRCKLTVIEEKGLPNKKKAFLKRSIFFSSIMICVGIILSMSFFVWRIDISGNTYHTNEEIIKFLSTNKVQIGNLKFGLNTKKTETLIYDEYSDIIWVSCEIKGTELVVNIKEELKVPESIPEEQSCDMVADKAGEIYSIVATKGTPLVAKGDVVEAGDTLISGSLETYEMTELLYVAFTHAKGDVYIKYTFDYYDEINFKYLEKVYDEFEYIDYSFIFNNKVINIVKPNKDKRAYDEINEQQQIEVIENYYMPLIVNRKIYKPYFEIEKLYSEAETEAILERKLKSKIEEIEKNDIQISQINVIYTHTGMNSIAYGTIEVIEKIGEEKIFDDKVRRQQYNEFFTEEDGDTT